MKNWRKTRDYRIWAYMVKKGARCAVCGTIKNRHAHHVNHATYFPYQRFDVENGVCLCGDCHSHYHCDYHRSYREKCSYYDWQNFLSLVYYLMKNITIKGQDYVTEPCPTCGSLNLVKKEEAGKWIYCRTCSKNSYYVARS